MSTTCFSTWLYGISQLCAINSILVANRHWWKVNLENEDSYTICNIHNCILFYIHNLQWKVWSLYQLDTYSYLAQQRWRSSRCQQNPQGILPSKSICEYLPLNDRHCLGPQYLQKYAQIWTSANFSLAKQLHSNIGTHSISQIEGCYQTNHNISRNLLFNHLYYLSSKSNFDNHRDQRFSCIVPKCVPSLPYHFCRHSWFLTTEYIVVIISKLLSCFPIVPFAVCTQPQRNSSKTIMLWSSVTRSVQGDWTGCRKEMERN